MQLSRIVGKVAHVLVDAARSALTETRQRPAHDRNRPDAPPRPARRPNESRRERTFGRPDTAYPGDYPGTLRPVYAADADGDPDPGEVVWTWVPYEDDHTKGKDRPVLLVGHDGPWLLALMLTSKDHDRDYEQEARAGRLWFDLGPGGWDSKGRPSEIRLDRVLRIDPANVRREGAILDRPRWDAVVAALP